MRKRSKNSISKKKKKLGLVGIAEYRNLIKHQIHFRELGLIINRRHTI